MARAELNYMKVKPTGVFSESPAVKSILESGQFRLILEEYYPVKVKPIKIGDFIGVPMSDLISALAAKQLVEEILAGHFE